MVKDASRMEREVRERMRGGSGAVEILHLFKEGELRSGKARLFARLRLAKGSSIGWHEHANEEEIFYVLSGRGLLSEEGGQKEIGPGDAALTGGGAGHAIENPWDEPLELLAVILRY